jgi:molecular chaperone DnaJ
MNRDPYATLGVPRSASQEDILKAYRTLASKWHPDKNPDNPSEAAEKFKQIAAAFEAIGDKQRRREFDFYGSSPFPAFNFRSRNAVDEVFDNLFSHVFGGRGANASRSRLKVTLAEAFSGCERIVKSEKHESCTSCSGTGSTEWTRCSRCEGSGFIFTSEGPMRIQTSCTQCSGRGSKPAQSCKECNGRGNKVTSGKDVVIKVPPGVEDGMQIRVAGESPDGGDLFVIVSVDKDPKLTRQQRNLFGVLEVPYSTLVLGGETKFEIFGLSIVVKIPPGTKSGARIRLPGQGMPHIQNASVRGDLFLDISLKLPSKVTKEYERLLLKIAKLDEAS